MMTSNGTPTLRIGVWKRRESCILIIYKNKSECAKGEKRMCERGKANLGKGEKRKGKSEFGKSECAAVDQYNFYPETIHT